MANEENPIGKYDVSRGVYVLHNGVEFKTLDEVKAFKLGLEMQQGNANAGMSMAIENVLKSIEDIEF